MDVIQFISAFGLGAIVTAVVQAWLSERADNAKRRFEEKKESYVGFLDAVYKSEIAPSVEASKNIGHWKNRIELVGSKEVVRSIFRFEETNPISGQVHPERPNVMSDLKNAMRKDLRVERHFNGRV